MFEAYIASHAGRTWKTTAFSRSATAFSRIAIISRFCSSTGSPGLLGQSMLETVATHAPRNSRGVGGGAPGPCTGACARAEEQAVSEVVVTSRRSRRAERRRREDAKRREDA